MPSLNSQLHSQLNLLSVKISEAENYGGEITQWEAIVIAHNHSNDCKNTEVLTQVIEGWGRKICEADQVTFFTPYDLQELQMDLQDDMCHDDLQLDSHLIEGTYQILIDSFTPILGPQEEWSVFEVGGVLSSKQKKFQDEEYLLESRFLIFCSNDSIISLTKVFVNESVPIEYREAMMNDKEVVFVTAKADRWQENAKREAAAKVEAAKAAEAIRNSTKNQHANVRRVSKSSDTQQKVACASFTPQAFKKTYCATCFCPQDEHVEKSETKVCHSFYFFLDTTMCNL